MVIENANNTICSFAFLVRPTTAQIRISLSEMAASFGGKNRDSKWHLLRTNNSVSHFFSFLIRNHIMANPNNGNRRRAGRGKAWTTEMVDYLATLFSDMWRQLGYNDNQYRNDENRFQACRVRLYSKRMISSYNRNWERPSSLHDAPRSQHTAPIHEGSRFMRTWCRCAR